MVKIDLWTEGYSCTGNQSGAIYHGKFEADNLADAVKQFKDTVTDEYSKSCIDTEKLTFWACRFFDNEADARKSFG